jgi:hypothetical protein
MLFFHQTHNQKRQTPNYNYTSFLYVATAFCLGCDTHVIQRHVTGEHGWAFASANSTAGFGALRLIGPITC